MNGLLPYDLPSDDLDTPPDLSGVDEVVIDTETTGLRWVTGDRPVGLAVAWGDQRVYLPFGHRGGGNLDEGQVKRFAQRELRGKRIIGFNTRFDVHMLRLWGVDLREQGNTLHDVSHDGCLLDDHRSKKRLRLQDFAEDYLGESKENIGRPEHIVDLPGSTVASYARGDVDLTQRLDTLFKTKIADEDLGRVSTLEDTVIPATVEMESHGLPIDVERTTRWRDDLQQIANTIARELHTAAGFACTPSKKPDMARLFHKAGISYGRTPTGLPEFDGEVVRQAATKDRAILLAYRWQKVQHLLSKVITPFLKRHVGGVLYPSFHQMLGDEGGTISGRFSSSNPNGQNLLNANKYDRAYGWLSEYTTERFLARDLVYAERGTWISADQKQVEPRIAISYAALLNDPDAPAWLARYRENPLLNFHGLVAEMVKKAAPDSPRTHTEIKIGGLQLLYGGGLGSLQSTIHLSAEEAETFRNDYRRGFPMMGRLLDIASRVANQRGYVKTQLGRRCRFLGTAGNRERCHKSLNAIVQGTAADDNKMALVAAYEQRQALGLTLRVTEHDALGGDLEGPLAPLEALLNEQRLGLPVPILWDCGTGRTWAEAKG